MEAGFVVLMIAAAVIGIVIGVCVEKRRTKRTKTKGDIYVYYGSPSEDPSLLLDCSVPISDIASQKRVLFNVVIIK